MKINVNLFASENIGRAFGVCALVGAVFTATAFAGSITKTFEFGAGTANSNSNKRTFNVPCGLDVTASIEHYRLGDAGAASDVPIVVELRKPGASADQEGEVAATKTATAKRERQTTTLSATESNRGCALPWVVRVKPASGQSPLAIKGSITVAFNDALKNLSVEGGLISLNKGNSVTKNVGGTSGLDQGTVTVTAKWLHAVGPVPGPLPVKLKFELLKPDGTPAQSDIGFSSAEINPCCSGDKMKVVFQVAERSPGQWKIRITNNTNNDTMNIDPKATFKPDCP